MSTIYLHFFFSQIEIKTYVCRIRIILLRIRICGSASEMMDPDPILDPDPVLDPDAVLDPDPDPDPT